MTRALAHWFGWFFSTTAQPALRPQQNVIIPLKIEVERLPNYLWRELGFAATRRPEHGPWRQVQ